MTDAATIAQRYIASWNEPNSQQRRALIAVLWADDASYVDPLMQGSGHAEIDALVAAVHDRFPGYGFALSGQADGYSDRVRFSWTLGKPGEPPVAHGTDFGITDKDGRLRSVTGFLDQVAAEALAQGQ
jgi:SnoaL-like domain